MAIKPEIIKLTGTNYVFPTMNRKLRALDSLTLNAIVTKVDGKRVTLFIYEISSNGKFSASTSGSDFHEEIEIIME